MKSTSAIARPLRRFLLTMLACWVPLPAALGCDEDDENGLDVALVLSGGGALATTHIGALTAIDQLGVPIHCVAGTSMGAVVGALYAAGYDSAALRRIFRDSRWPELFAGDIPRRDEPYLRKEQDDLYLSGYVAGVDARGLRLPGGFRNMTGLQSLYRELLLGLPVDQDFDALPLPYRAVATDLATGAPVALDSGDVVEAMLASMAVPGVFPPRKIDGRTLVDGGLSSQLPVSIAKDMGADLIIALDTTVEPPEPTDGWSVGQVSQQLIRLTVWQNWQRERDRMGEHDVLIQPDISSLTTSSFGRAEEGFASGEAAARAFRAELLLIRELAAPAPERERSAPRPPRAGTLLVDNTSIIRDRLVERRLGYAPDTLDEPDARRRKLRDLAAFGPFSEADLALQGDGTARLRVRPLPLGRNLLNAGFQASTNFRGDSRFGLRGRFSRRPLGPSGSELRISGLVGSDLGLTAEWYRPFGPESRFFVLPAVSYKGEEFLFDFAGERIAEAWQQTGEASFRLGRELGDWGIIAADAVFSHVDTEILLSAFPIADESEKYAGASLLLAVDTLDGANWPSHGLQLRSSVRWLDELDSDGGELTTRYRLKATQALDLDLVNVLLRLDTQTIDSGSGNPSDILRLGGFRRLSSRPENALISDQYTLGGIEIFRRLGSSESLLSIPLYVGAMIEYADVDLDLLPGFDDEYYAFSGYLGLNTMIGPLYLGAGFGDDGEHSVFMHFGYSF